MNKEILKQLETELLKENGQITLGDTSKTTILNAFKQEDMSLENILISLYNMAKISQYKVAELENNLFLLANRVYKINEDFSKEEKLEIYETLRELEINQLKNIENHIGCLHDGLYCSEEDFDKAENQKEILMNKIKYPTPPMYATFKELVAEELKFKEMSKRRCK